MLSVITATIYFVLLTPIKPTVTMLVSMERWAGTVAVVTGASSGIGEAISIKLVEEGLTVVGLARRCERIEANAKKLLNKPGKLYSVCADLTKEEDILKAYRTIEEKLGHVHVLINCAGVSKESDLSSGKTEDWRRTLEVNVLALSIMTREAVKIMKANCIAGHIIHFNSIVGHKLPPEFKSGAMYAASKHAVTALAEGLRHELTEGKSKIKITSVSPGMTESEMTTQNKEYSEERKKIIRASPHLKPEDVAEAVVYILSTPPHVQIQELTIAPVGERI